MVSQARRFRGPFFVQVGWNDCCPRSIVRCTKLLRSPTLPAAGTPAGHGREASLPIRRRYYPDLARDVPDAAGLINETSYKRVRRGVPRFP